MQNQITVNGRQITWVAETRTAMAEASTLGLKVGQWPETINVVSHKTGDIRTWKKSHIDSRGNHCYKMTTSQGCSNVWSLLVFND